MRLWPFRRRVVQAVKESRPGHRYIYVGADEALERQTRALRQEADRIRREANRLDTRDDGTNCDG